jgi:hypothetical protein
VVAAALLAVGGAVAAPPPAQATENGYTVADTSYISARTFYPHVQDGYQDYPGSFSIHIHLDPDNFNERYYLARWEVFDSAGRSVGLPSSGPESNPDWVSDAPVEGDVNYLCGQYYDTCKDWRFYWQGAIGNEVLPVGDYTVKAWIYDSRAGRSSERLALSQDVTIATGTRTVLEKETLTRKGARATSRHRTGECRTTKVSGYYAGSLDLDCHGPRGYAKATWTLTLPADASDVRPSWIDVFVYSGWAHIARRVGVSGSSVTFTARANGHRSRPSLRVGGVKVTYSVPVTRPI